MYKLGLEKAEEQDIKLSMFGGSWRKQGSSRETFTSASLTMLKALAVYITTKCQTPLLVSWETCMWIKKQQLELDMKQWTDSQLGKVSSPCLFNLYAEYVMQNAGLDKLESRLPGEISTTSDIQLIPL